MTAPHHRRTYIYLALSMMTASWITLLLRSFLGDAGPSAAVTFFVLTLLTLIPLGFSRWVRGLGLRRDLQRAVLAGAFAFLSLLVVSSGFYNDYGLLGGGWLNRLVANELSDTTFLNQSTSVALVALCWWLGLFWGDTPLTTSNLFRYFYICILAQVLPSIFFLSDVSQDLPWLYFAFLFAALMMLGLGRVESAARRSQHQDSPFTLYWLVQMGLVAGVLIGLTGLAQILGLARGFGLILVVVAPVIAALVYPVAFVGAKIGALLLTRLFSQMSQAAESPDQAVAGPSVTQGWSPTSPGNICLGLVTLVFFLVVLFAVIYGARRVRELVREQEGDERAALPSLGQQVSDAVVERLERVSFNLPGFARLRERLAARSIRRVYAALTLLGAERGYPRPAARTPHEHLPALRRALPGCEIQVAEITEAYVAVHYGEVPESREALQEIRAAWEHVRETARRAAPLESGAAKGSGRV